MGLTAAGFEQTRGMIRNIEDKTAATMVYVGPCGGYYDNCYNREPLYNLVDFAGLRFVFGRRAGQVRR